MSAALATEELIIETPERVRFTLHRIIGIVF